MDYKVDEKKLKEVFKLAGKVVSAELSLDKEGKSRGFGVVEYEHPVEAVQAICILLNCIVLDFIMYSYLSKQGIICHSFLGKPNTGHLLTSPDSIVKKCLNPFQHTIDHYWKKCTPRSHGNTSFRTVFIPSTS